MCSVFPETIIIMTTQLTKPVITDNYPNTLLLSSCLNLRLAQTCVLCEGVG